MFKPFERVSRVLSESLGILALYSCLGLSLSVLGAAGLALSSPMHLLWVISLHLLLFGGLSSCLSDLQVLVILWNQTTPGKATKPDSGPATGESS